MRILHTADWHLTEKLGSVDRRPDLLARLQEVAAYLDEHKVDVMVVAGDMFSALFLKSTNKSGQRRRASWEDQFYLKASRYTKSGSESAWHTYKDAIIPSLTDEHLVNRLLLSSHMMPYLQA